MMNGHLSKRRLSCERLSYHISMFDLILITTSTVVFMPSWIFSFSHVQYHTDKLVDEAEVLRVAKEKTEQEGGFDVIGVGFSLCSLFSLCSKSISLSMT